MEDVIIAYLDKFEEKVRTSLLSICTSRRMLAGKLLESDDLKAYWKEIEPNYMADAVPQIQDYPLVSVGWAAYIGMAVAHYWDTDWQNHAHDVYESYYGDQGFDNMDDHIVRDILGLPLDSIQGIQLVKLVQSLSQEVISLIRHEQIEPQSKLAFYAYVRSCNAMFAIGAALELHRLGYKFEKLR